MRPDYSELITAVYQYGSYQRKGQEAISSLVRGGVPAFRAFLTMRKCPPASEIHPRDLIETFIDVIAEFAKEMPDEVIDRFEAGELNEIETYWALGAANGERSIDVLIAGLRSEHKICRWAAAESLIQRKSRRATPDIIEALKDRSSIVKVVVVQAMLKQKRLRRPEALPALRRIAANQSIRQHSPGLHKSAEEVIQLIEREINTAKS